MTVDHNSKKSGRFIISLDFELLWGLRDHVDKRSSYAQNVVGARRAVPMLLELFDEFKISATWATVGFLYCRSKEELYHYIPSVKPNYEDLHLSNYTFLEEIGTSEKTDPYYFAPSLIDLIRATPRQEIATHTLSHFYCLEPGSSLSAFKADISKAKEIAASNGDRVQSIVFPRNQYSRNHIEICKNLGIDKFRGTRSGWVHGKTKKSEQHAFRRALRYADSVLPIPSSESILRNLNANRSEKHIRELYVSRFLRPYSSKVRYLNFMHLRVIKREMLETARRGEDFHLWWHPHNFGSDLDQNIGQLRDILYYFKMLQECFGMHSACLREL